MGHAQVAARIGVLAALALIGSSVATAGSSNAAARRGVIDAPAGDAALSVLVVDEDDFGRTGTRLITLGTGETTYLPELDGQFVYEVSVRGDLRIAPPDENASITNIRGERLGSRYIANSGVSAFSPDGAWFAYNSDTNDQVVISPLSSTDDIGPVHGNVTSALLTLEQIKEVEFVAWLTADRLIVRHDETEYLAKLVDHVLDVYAVADADASQIVADPESALFFHYAKRYLGELDRETGGITQISSDFPASEWDATAAWSPRGGRLAFGVAREGLGRWSVSVCQTRAELACAAVSGLPTSLSSARLVWSPDGTTLCLDGFDDVTASSSVYCVAPEGTAANVICSGCVLRGVGAWIL